MLCYTRVRGGANWNKTNLIYWSLIMANKKVVFTSQKNAEDFPGQSDIAVISITDDGDANLCRGFGLVVRHRFIDGVYDETSINNFASLSPAYNHEQIYGSYFSESDAIKLLSDINKIMGMGFRKILIHCMAGRARSAAVAKYISTRYGFKVYNSTEALTENASSLNECTEMDFKDENKLVLTLLSNPQHFSALIKSLERKNGKGGIRKDETILDKVKRLLNI